MPDSELLKRCLKLQKEGLVQGQYSWFGVDIICEKAKINLYTKQQEGITAEINNTTQQPKLRTYKLLKNNCRLEPYLLINLSRKAYNKSARFRTSSHSLRIKTGRHKK